MWRWMILLVVLYIVTGILMTLGSIQCAVCSMPFVEWAQSVSVFWVFFWAFVFAAILKW